MPACFPSSPRSAGILPAVFCGLPARKKPSPPRRGGPPVLPFAGWQPALPGRKPTLTHHSDLLFSSPRSAGILPAVFSFAGWQPVLPGKASWPLVYFFLCGLAARPPSGGTPPAAQLRYSPLPGAQASCLPVFLLLPGAQASCLLLLPIPSSEGWPQAGVGSWHVTTRRPTPPLRGTPPRRG